VFAHPDRGRAFRTAVEQMRRAAAVT